MQAFEGGVMEAAPQATTQTSVMDHSHLLQLFLYLQALDFMTTMVGFRLGLGEASPFVRWLTTFDPAVGVLASKIIAVVIAGFCVWRQRFRTIRLINYWYAVLVLWNLSLLVLASRQS